MVDSAAFVDVTGEAGQRVMHFDKGAITVSWNCEDVRIDLKNRFDDLPGRFSPTKVRDIAREEYQIHLAD